MESLRTSLLTRQHSDGGWGWLSEEPSDALATGMALHGLQRTGGFSGDALARTQQFLISTQRPDGAWSVPGTKQASRERSTSTSDYWGTAWAVIGLLEQTN